MEALLGSTLLGKSGETATATALEGKTVGLYFSAHCVRPARAPHCHVLRFDMQPPPLLILWLRCLCALPVRAGSTHFCAAGC